MLTFVVPLQSPGASNDWSVVSKLAIRCLDSLLQQTEETFAVILVCNEPPINLATHPRLTVIDRPFPLPVTREARMIDKWDKVRAGLVAAREFAPGHVMVVDADDCVSRQLASFVGRHPHAHGWIFERGYLHDEGSSLIYLWRDGFDAACGTSSIVRVEPSDLPTSVEGGRGSNPILRGGHTKIRQEMESRQTPLVPLPFPGAVYNLATGENDSGRGVQSWHRKKGLLEKLFRCRPLTRRIQHEFGLYNISGDWKPPHA